VGETIHMDFWWRNLLKFDHMKYQKEDRIIAFISILGDG
jgi:hypothetical protein